MSSGSIDACCHHRQQFAERLEVISYPERKRRATVGYVLLVRVHVTMHLAGSPCRLLDHYRLLLWLMCQHTAAALYNAMLDLEAAFPVAGAGCRGSSCSSGAAGANAAACGAGAAAVLWHRLRGLQHVRPVHRVHGEESHTRYNFQACCCCCKCTMMTLILPPGRLQGCMHDVMDAWCHTTWRSAGRLSAACWLVARAQQPHMHASCTAQAGAWDVDDRGLEYMPSVDLARRIQAKVCAAAGAWPGYSELQKHFVVCCLLLCCRVICPLYGATSQTRACSLNLVLFECRCCGCMRVMPRWLLR